MAVDHANYFVARQHSSGEHWGGPFPAYEDGLSFLTRLITHPVAPGFAFLMGVSMVLFAHSRRRQGWSEGAILRHFLTRGLVLILLQFTVVNLAWQLGPEPFPRFYMGVLAALGGGMILGSLVLRLPAAAQAILGVVLLVGIEFTHPDPSEWGLIFEQPLGLIFGYSGGDTHFWSNYPILPWLELVVFGMAFGKWTLADDEKAYRSALWIGLGCLAAFWVIRVGGGFGNIRPREGDDWIGFLNVVKYPPALTFTLLTIGFILILLSLFARDQVGASAIAGPLIVFGRVPLFFYVVHLHLYALMGIWLAPNGTSLLALYVFWAAGLIVLYPACRWYAGVKSRHRNNALLRLT
jgi:uncharacterized membrane protein